MGDDRTLIFLMNPDISNNRELQIFETFMGREIPMDSLNRKTLFWVLITLAISLFILFVLLALFIDPQDVQASGLVDLAAADELRMIWILALMLFLGPIIMILVTAATIMLLKDVQIPQVVQYADTSNFKSQVIGRKQAPVQNVTPAEAEEAQASLDDLNLRFIRGEITKEQYDEMKLAMEQKGKD